MPKADLGKYFFSVVLVKEGTISGGGGYFLMKMWPLPTKMHMVYNRRNHMGTVWVVDYPRQFLMRKNDSKVL